jgi:thiamine pyrophosphate-dependent acetolactate synthase large subunit-like protein
MKFWPYQRAIADSIGFPARPQRGTLAFAAVARGFGIAGFTIEDRADCAETLRQALAQPGPVVVDGDCRPV